jgi:radical SAM superfamily enzyme YgiQ (UPF0313 family)
MITVGFIFPSSDYLQNPFKGDPHTHLQVLTVIEDRLEGKAAPCLIDLRGISRDFALYHIPECDVYLHSVYTLDYDEQVSIVQALRARYPGAKHIAGGPHVTVFEQEALTVFDSLVLGDGEESIVSALTDLIGGRLQSVYRQQKPTDLNQYSIPRRHFMPASSVARTGMMNLKRRQGFEKLLGTTVVFGRGCPFQCAFCSMPRLKDFNPGIRYKHPQLVKAEIEYLQRDYGMQGINILDEIGIPVRDKLALPYLEAIGQTGITWRGQCRVDTITPEIARAASASGCVAMGLGVESVSQRSLDIVNKKTDLSRARRTISLLKENGIETRIYMIIGLPGESENIVEATWSFIQETAPDLVVLSLFTVRPGTEVYEHPERFGIASIGTDWKKTMHMFGRYDNETPTLTFEYARQTAWGASFTPKQIVDHYLELQTRLRECGLSSLK